MIGIILTRVSPRGLAQIHQCGVTHRGCQGQEPYGPFLRSASCHDHRFGMCDRGSRARKTIYRELSPSSPLDLKYQKDTRAPYGRSVDIWAMGLACYQLPLLAVSHDAPPEHFGLPRSEFYSVYAIKYLSWCISWYFVAGSTFTTSAPNTHICQDIEAMSLGRSRGGVLIGGNGHLIVQTTLKEREADLYFSDDAG